MSPQENMEHITSDKILSLIDMNVDDDFDKLIPQVIELIHLNKNYPENHNIYISNTGIKIKKDNKWKKITATRDDHEETVALVKNIIHDKYLIIINKYDSLVKTKINKKTQQQFEQFKKLYNKKYKKLMEDILNRTLDQLSDFSKKDNI